MLSHGTLSKTSPLLTRSKRRRLSRDPELDQSSHSHQACFQDVTPAWLGRGSILDSHNKHVKLAESSRLHSAHDSHFAFLQICLG